MKSSNGWVIKAYDGEALWFTAADTRSRSIRDIVTASGIIRIKDVWRHLKRKGFSCVKVRIVEGWEVDGE